MADKLHIINKFLLTDSKLASLIADSKAHETMLKTVKNLLPEPLNQHCCAAILHDQLLILYADSSAWASRLRYFSRNLSRHLQKQGVIVNKISIRITTENKNK